MNNLLTLEISCGEKGPFRSADLCYHSVYCPEADTDSESCVDSPFIYCSPTTREVYIAAWIPINQSLTNEQLLLRLEKNPHRINFHRGILESRQQHYKHLRKLLVSFTAVGECKKLICAFRRQYH